MPNDNLYIVFPSDSTTNYLVGGEGEILETVNGPYPDISVVGLAEEYGCSVRLRHPGEKLPQKIITTLPENKFFFFVLEKQQCSS